jgi:hypothetical protein
MLVMKSHLAGFAIAVLLVVGSISPGLAEETATPASPAPTQAEAPPPSVPRPSLVPKAAEPVSPSAATETIQPTRPRFAHRRYRHWGIYHTAYWEAFPIYWPHLYHHRIRWTRIPWVLHF